MRTRVRTCAYIYFNAKTHFGEKRRNLGNLGNVTSDNKHYKKDYKGLPFLIWDCIIGNHSRIGDAAHRLLVKKV